MSDAPQHQQDSVREDRPGGSSLPSLVLPQQPFAGGLPLDLDLDAPVATAADEPSRIADLPGLPDISAPAHGAAPDSPVDPDTAAAAVASQVGLGAFHEDVQRVSDRRTADRGTPDRRATPRPYASPWMARPEDGALDPRPQHAPAPAPDTPLTPIDTRVPDLPVPAMEGAPTFDPAETLTMQEPLSVPDVVPAREEAQAVAAPAGDVLASVFDVSNHVGSAMASPHHWYAASPEEIAAALAPEPVVAPAEPPVAAAPVDAPVAGTAIDLPPPPPAPAAPVELPAPVLPPPVAGTAIDLPAPGTPAPDASQAVLPAPPAGDPAALLPAPGPVAAPVEPVQGFQLPAPPTGPAAPASVDANPYMADLIAANPALAELASRGGLAAMDAADEHAERPVYAPWKDVRPSMTSVAEVMTVPAAHDVPTPPAEPAPVPTPTPAPALAAQVVAATPVASEGHVVIDPTLLAGASVGTYLPHGIELGAPIAEMAPGSVTAAEHLAAHPRPGILARAMWMLVIPAVSGVVIGELLYYYIQHR